MIKMQLDYPAGWVSLFNCDQDPRSLSDLIEFSSDDEVDLEFILKEDFDVQIECENGAFISIKEIDGYHVMSYDHRNKLIAQKKFFLGKLRPNTALFYKKVKQQLLNIGPDYSFSDLLKISIQHY